MNPRSILLHDAATTPAPVSTFDRPAPRPAQRPSAPIEELRASAIAALQARLGELFTRAPTELLNLAERASGEQSRRRPMELIRTLDMERPRLLRSFEREIERSFRPLAAPGAIDIERDRLTRMPTEELEEQAALNHLATRTAQLHPDLVNALRGQLQHAARARGAEIAPQALSPHSLCEAWRASLHAAEMPFDERLIVHQLFDRFVLQRLAPLYQDLLSILDRHGWTAVEDGVSLKPDGRTRECLERTAAATERADDAALATSLLEALDAPQAHGAQALVQRIALVGQMLNEILADANLPSVFAPLFELQRFAVIKAALADLTFFGTALHPLRQRLAHAAEQGVCARLGGTLAMRHLETLLLALPMQTDIAAGLIRSGLWKLPLLPAAEVARFVDAQHQASAARRETLLTRVRRIVAQELEVQSLGLRIAPAARTLVHAGMGPLLAIRLRRFGIEHRMWHDAVDRLGQVLRSLEPRAVDASALHRSELLDALRADCADIGLARARIDNLAETLTRTWAALAPPAPAPDDDLALAQAAAARLDPSLNAVAVLRVDVPAPALQPSNGAGDELLRSVLQPDQWFRLYRADGDETLWLRLVEYDPHAGEVRFCGFDGIRSFCLPARTVDEDLRRGRSEPVDPTPAMQAALLELRRR